MAARCHGGMNISAEFLREVAGWQSLSITIQCVCVWGGGGFPSRDYALSIRNGALLACSPSAGNSASMRDALVP